MKKINKADSLLDIYKLLHKKFGPRDWWPGETKLEIIIGAILTQNTAWRNVEKAIQNLKKSDLLKIKKLSRVSEKRLSGLIKPSGYYNVKARRIKNFLDFLNTSYEGSINRMFREKTEKLRKKLLDVKGIGPETADSILLYAGEKPVFVVDAYTKRIFSRHRYIHDGADYSEVQELFIKSLPKDTALFNEYHALIVELGKNLCKSNKPLCNVCPIEGVKHGR